MDIYQRLKVKTYINAWDAVSAYGSSRMEPETLAAMRDAASKYVPIRDLQQAVGRKIAQMTGNEAAYVVSGTAAGMLLASAVCMVRHPEPELFAMLPNAQELRNEFILLRERKTSVGYAIKAAGGKVKVYKAALNEQIIGVNTPDQLAQTEHFLRLRGEA